MSTPSGRKHHNDGVKIKLLPTDHYLFFCKLAVSRDFSQYSFHASVYFEYFVDECMIKLVHE